MCVCERRFVVTWLLYSTTVLVVVFRGSRQFERGRVYSQTPSNWVEEGVFFYLIQFTYCYFWSHDDKWFDDVLVWFVYMMMWWWWWWWYMYCITWIIATAVVATKLVINKEVICGPNWRLYTRSVVTSFSYITLTVLLILVRGGRERERESNPFVKSLLPSRMMWKRMEESSQNPIPDFVEILRCWSLFVVLKDRILVRV